MWKRPWSHAWPINNACPTKSERQPSRHFSETQTPGKLRPGKVWCQLRQLRPGELWFRELGPRELRSERHLPRENYGSTKLPEPAFSLPCSSPVRRIRAPRSDSPYRLVLSNLVRWVLGHRVFLLWGCFSSAPWSRICYLSSSLSLRPKQTVFEQHNTNTHQTLSIIWVTSFRLMGPGSLDLLFGRVDK